MDDLTQARRDRDQAVRAFVVEQLMAKTTPEQRDGAVAVLDTIAGTPTDRLWSDVPKDRSGNPRTESDEWRRWNSAIDLTERAQVMGHILRNMLIEAAERDQ